MVEKKFSLRKKFFLFLSLIFLFFVSTASAVEYKFDFQPPGSPVQAGFIEINKNTMYAASSGYGWDASYGPPANDLDRAIGSDLERDFIYDSLNREFDVDLPNGKYDVTVYLGDKDAYAHDDMNVYAETVLKLSGVDTAANEVKELMFTIGLSGGQLNLIYQDAGGADPNWVSEGLIIKPSTITVCSSGCDFTTIQDAVNAAAPGGKVEVAAGTYDEQVVIDKSLTLQGAGDTTIVKPSSAVKLTTILDSHWWGNGFVAGIIVANVPGGSVTVKNLKVDGADITTRPGLPSPSGADNVAGIFYLETGGIISNTVVVDMVVGSTGTSVRGYGIILSASTNTVSVEVKGSTITNFDKNGIDAENGKLTVNIHDNTVTGRGSLPIGDEVQNGILIEDGTVGTVNHNTISNMAYTPLDWWSVGILFFDNGGSGTANDNTITNCQQGIVYQDGSGSAENNVINDGTVGITGLWAQYTKVGTWTVSFLGNTVSSAKDSLGYAGSGLPLILYETAAIGAQTYNAGASLTVIIDGNHLTSASSTDADGILIGDTLANDAAGSIAATITHNSISNWPKGIEFFDTVDYTNTHVNFNDIAGNTIGISNSMTVGSGTIDAIKNWWGSDTGPGPVGSGSGDKVSDYVDFDFWLMEPFTPSDHTKPKVQQLILNPSSPVPAGTLLFTIIFNQGMDISVIPEVKLTKGSTTYIVNPDSSPSYTNGWSNVKTWNGKFVVTQSTGDGEYKVKISKARDLNGNIMSTDSSNKIVIDTTSPQFYQTFVPNIFVNQDLTLAVSVFDPGSSGISGVTAKIDTLDEENMLFGFRQQQRIGGKNVDVDTYYLTRDGSIFTVPSHSVVFKVTDKTGNQNITLSIPFTKDSSVKVTGGAIAFLCKNKPVSEIVKKFDFGTKNSPVQTGYTRVTNDTTYPTASSYGWSSAVFGSIDRATGDKLKRDLVFDSASREFKVNLPSNTYNVTILMGDMLYAHDDMSVTIEGIPTTDIDTDVGQIKVITKIVDVTDGQLNIVFSDGGGSDSNWVVNGIEISSPPACLDGIEKQTIDWLISKGWTVDFNKFTDWSLASLIAHNLIVCSDQEDACNPTSAVSAAHQFNNRPFVEIADSNSARAAKSFKYLSASGGTKSKATVNEFFDNPHSISTGFFGSTQILLSPQRLTKITSNLSPSAKDIAAPDDSQSGTNMFAVDQSGSQGRFVYVGWLYGRRTSSGFTGWTPFDLNTNGQLLLTRSLNWAQCGNPTGCI